MPETWFFRDRHAFTALARLAREEWLPAHPDGVLSLLEPAVLDRRRAVFDGDGAARRRRPRGPLSHRRGGHQRARPGAGRARRVRKEFLSRRGARRSATGISTRRRTGYRLSETVRQQVRFQQGNLFAAGFLPGVALYDVIFCRNVLIYFDRADAGPRPRRAEPAAARRRACCSSRRPRPACPRATAWSRRTSRWPSRFGRRRRVRPEPKRARRPPAAGRRRGRPVATPAPALRPARRGRCGAGCRATAPVAAGGRPSADLDEATRLADQGHFVEAATCCEEHLRRRGPSATAFYLMGLVRDATGNQRRGRRLLPEGALSRSQSLRHADPSGLLMEKQGDTAGAQVLRNRARRLEQKRKASHE